ncbi:MAG TPA: response regulator [Thermoanaerobaculia bacterium]|nr:response regulator [Thermoanaerobaculia bacterium]
MAAVTRVLIVDDEDPARAVLREMLGGVPHVEIVGESSNGFDAVRAASELKPDCVFLDIQMPRLDGFEVMELLDPSIAVVFVTAYDQYAVKAFDVHAVDYVLKPFSETRLGEALARARARLESGRRQDAAAIAAATRPPGQFASRIVVRDGPNIRVIPVEKLDLAEARDDLVVLKSEGKTFSKAQTLAALVSSLDPSRFLRVHRSYVINLDRLRQVELYAKNSHVAILADGSRIPISREGHARLKEFLDSSPSPGGGGPG